MDHAATDAPEKPRPTPERAPKARRNQAFDAALGAQIRALRIAADMSQAALGRAIGISFQQMQKYELGKNRLSASTLKAIADALRVSPGSLYGDDLQVRIVPDAGGDAGTKIVRLLQQIDDPQLRRRLMELIQALALALDTGSGEPS